MNDPENNFPPELIDKQVEQPDTLLPSGNARLIHDLQAMYDQEKNAAIERVWTQMVRPPAITGQQPEPRSLHTVRREPDRSIPLKTIDTSSRPGRRFTHAFNLIAAVTVCTILVGCLALVFRLAQHPSTTGSQPAALATPKPTSSASGEQQGKIVASWVSGGPTMNGTRAFSWSPDSRFIAIANQEEVEITNAANGKTTHTITPGGLFAAWSPDGRYLAVDNRIYNANTGGLVRELPQSTTAVASTGHSLLSATIPHSGGNGVYTIAWSPDSSLLAGSVFTGPTGVVMIWDVQTGKIVYTFRGQSEDVIGSLAWSPDGKNVASASFDGVIKVWSAHTGQVIFQHATNNRGAGLAWAHKGPMLAFLSAPDTIEVWNITTRKKITSLRADANYSLVWSPDDTRIASTSGNNVIIWNATTGVTIYQFTRHKSYVTALAWSPNGKYIVSSSNNVSETNRPATPVPSASVTVVPVTPTPVQPDSRSIITFVWLA